MVVKPFFLVITTLLQPQAHWIIKILHLVAPLQWY